MLLWSTSFKFLFPMILCSANAFFKQKSNHIRVIIPKYKIESYAYIFELDKLSKNVMLQACKDFPK